MLISGPNLSKRVLVREQQSIGQTWTIAPPSPFFVNKFLSEHSHIHLFKYCFAAFALQQQSWVVTTENIWPTELKIFTLWAFILKSLPTLV